MIMTQVRRKIFALIAVAGLLGGLLFYQHILGFMGNLLIYEQIPQKADLIVVLNGRDTERSLAAVDLYNAGYGNLIVLARGEKQPGCDELSKRAGKKFDGTIFFQRALEAMGVPARSFMLIGGGVSSTYDEAIVTKKFALENGFRSLLLVTSKWHSRRAYLTFRSAFGKKAGIQIMVYPSKYDTFDPNAWWKKKSDTRIVATEYVKFLYYILTSRVSIF
jgi:uncharacterized SAM-binding protein YcdF (DUF218 family)